MNDFVTNNKQNASVRGYIMRSLVKGCMYSVSVNSLSKKLVDCGLQSTPDISGHLYYLQGCRLIEFTESNVTPFNALEKDAIIRLTVEGIKFIENGGNDEMGIDL